MELQYGRSGSLVRSMRIHTVQVCEHVCMLHVLEQQLGSTTKPYHKLSSMRAVGPAYTKMFTVCCVGFCDRKSYVLPQYQVDQTNSYGCYATKSKNKLKITRTLIPAQQDVHHAFVSVCMTENLTYYKSRCSLKYAVLVRVPNRAKTSQKGLKNIFPTI